MSDNLKDILSNLNKGTDQEKLLAYLQKQLADKEAHDIEQQMADDPFMNDAVEGLEDFKNKKDLSLYLQQLNKDLKKQTKKKFLKKQKRKLANHPWMFFAIVLLLTLAIIGYVIIKKFLG